MTTNRDIFIDRMTDALIQLNVRGIMADYEYHYLQDDIEALAENIEEKELTPSQIKQFTEEV